MVISLNVLALCEKHFLVKMIKQAQAENKFPGHIMITEVVLYLNMKSRGYVFFQPNYKFFLTYNGHSSLDKSDFESHSSVVLLSLMSCIKSQNNL